MAECASDDQRRHRRLTLAPTPEPRRDEEVLVEDCSDDEEDEQGAWTTVSQGGHRRLGRFWAQGSDDEESIAPSSPEELISTASREVAERQEAKRLRGGIHRSGGALWILNGGSRPSGAGS
jgi:hypothetical protein